MGRPIRKVLIIEPRNPQPHIFSRVAIPRLGCVLLGTILQQQGLEVKVVVEEISTPDYATLDFSPDLVGVSTITSTAPRAFELADYYRDQGIPVVLGGPHPSFLPEESLQHADYVISGEGDEALPELVAALKQGVGLASIQNLSFQGQSGIQKNPMRPLLRDLDSLPIPDYGLIHSWRSGKQGVISIATSRGCPYGCRFCQVIQMFGRKYRFNSMERVITEIQQNAMQAGHIFFCDDNFTADRQRIKTLMNRIIELGLKLEWSAQVRVEAARDAELLELMARAGCFMVFIGLESINPATLMAYKKSQTVEDIQACVHNFHQNSIKVHGMFIFGSEEDNVQVIRDTVAFSRQIDIDSLQYLILTPIPGTPVYQEIKEEGRLLNRDWSSYDGHHAVFLPRYMTPYELQMESYLAMKNFYTWTSVLKRLIRRDWFFAKLKLHGRLHLRRCYQQNQGYFRQLKAELFSRARQWRSLWPQRRIRRVGIPEDIWRLTAWESAPKEFLLRFIEKLGVEVVRESLEIPATADVKAEPGQIAALLSQITNLQGKADLVLLPFWQGVDNVRQKARELGDDLGGRLDSFRQTLAFDFNPNSFYNACMQLGLCFKSRPRLIRRIYFQTLGEIEAAI